MEFQGLFRLFEILYCEIIACAFNSTGFNRQLSTAGFWPVRFHFFSKVFSIEILLAPCSNNLLPMGCLRRYAERHPGPHPYACASAQGSVQWLFQNLFCSEHISPSLCHRRFVPQSYWSPVFEPFGSKKFRFLGPAVRIML